ncbi:Lrp/AsnC ligand binding domain-containing protein [Streptomyces sp. 4503]|uniref:Lrp/AsnC ligand binding domain-containing protein n=5 Tax=Streptomyces TaxID=1883 RepID=A0A4D4K1R4_9ACTN|nr:MULTISPECIES: Lrp/AsnC ligand binding domain-containing protein [Streptomyces]MEE4587106.1 Lrp/AsnC ligand binding domain-containing protein [Streptomyces sp. DSM 41602]AEM86589.1 Transcription regulator, AsnC-type [Streptomyces violaceusniger Tu 4113]AJZ85324.1 Lrp/AsnC ligand binding domain-containing protein [Streptomyces sp. AgN23]AQW50223.1 AsnC family transcriptional regulator [Streptomyces hygroscopicus]ASQ94130.1 AsnC family transcriptional regulator [Streptomyces sp. 11-1-2]
MITSIVLIKTSVDRIPETAEKIAALENVSEVYSVTGAHDLIAMVRVARHDDLADIITGQISKLPGVASTETHIAFRTYSQHDLEAAFAIGLDG